MRNIDRIPTRPLLVAITACSLLMPGAAGASEQPEAPDPVDQVEFPPSGWVAEAVVDLRGGGSNEIEIYRALGHGLAVGGTVETEATRLESIGFGALASIGVSERLPIDLAVSGEIIADRHWRPHEAVAQLIAGVEGEGWSADGNLALRQGLAREIAGRSYDYAWAVRAKVRDRWSLVTEGGGRLHASAERRAAGLRGHFVGVGVVMAQRGGREFGLSVLRQARWGRAPLLLRCALQFGFGQVVPALASEDVQ